MPPPRKAPVPGSTSGSKQLNAWLNALPPVPSINSPAMDLLIELAVQYRPRMLNLLKDLQVVTAVDQAVLNTSQTCSPTIAVERVARLLIDACWVSQVPSASNQLIGKASNQAGTRTAKLRELVAAAKTAKDLGKGLQSLTAKSLTVSHLSSRFEAGNPTIFSHQRRGWNTAMPKTSSPHISSLLETLAWELTEEAALLSLNIENTRQRGSSRREINILIDHLLQQSVNLGAINRKGQPAPDFDLVHAVVTSLLPAFPLDISTARKRWATRQGKLKLKNP
jgi:hypothetical protein